MELKDLIERGYFPKELPPAFSSSKLAHNLEEVLIQWKTIFENNTKIDNPHFVLSKLDEESSKDFKKRKKVHKKNFINQYNSSKTSYFSISKSNLSRRFLGIPNPKHFIFLAKIIIDNWELLANFFTISPYSESFPVAERDAKKRAVSTFSRNVFTFRDKLLETSFDKLIQIRVDISKFYPTIYTHSITWALLGKEKAKYFYRQDQLDYEGDTEAELYTIGNEIDKRIRNCQDKQSIGIPIGPDTSHIIAEVIACRIDQLLQEKFTNIDLKGCRYYDDYYLFVSTKDQADQVLKSLQKILRDFQLEINESKVSIKEFPFSFEDEFTLILSQVDFKNKNLSYSIQHYFSLVWGWVEKQPSKSDWIFKYALRTFEFRTTEIPQKNWKLFENLLLKTALVEPAVLDIVTRILLTYQNFLDQDSRKKIKSLIEQTIKNHSQMSHDFEVSWSLWLAKTFKIIIEDEVVNYVFEMTNTISLLILLDITTTTNLVNKNKCDQYFSQFSKDWDINILFSEYWLLAYEGIKKGWLTSSNANLIQENHFFKILNDLDIEFYNSSRQLEVYKPKSKSQDYYERYNNQETPESKEQKKKTKTPELQSTDIEFLLPSNLY